MNGLLDLTGREPAAEDEVEITGTDPVLPTRFLLGTAGAAVIAAAGVTAADLWRLQTGRRQRVGVDLRAAGAAMRSGNYLRIDGKPPPGVWSDISGFYQTGDGRWIQLHCNFPHHRAGVLKLLGCGGERAAVASAVAQWQGQKLEDALAAAAMCAGLVRSREEWETHPQGRAVAPLPAFEIVKIGESPPEPLPAGDRPLAGVRVLDLTRVIAGPIGGRTLAEHGADVLRITAAHLPGFPDGVDIDTGHGKLSANLDLNRAEDAERLRSLVRDADVFSQSYRPDSLAARGFSPEALAALRPGIVYVTLSAFSREGPWRDRRGYDSLVQTVSGIVHEHSGDGEPRHLPAQAIDYVSGYLIAFGAMSALARRAREGGSYHVRVSLAQTGRWITSLGRTPPGADTPRDLRFEDIPDLLMESESPFGRLAHLAPAVRLSETPPRWARPSVPLGSSPAAWPEHT